MRTRTQPHLDRHNLPWQPSDQDDEYALDEAEAYELNALYDRLRALAQADQPHLVLPL